MNKVDFENRVISVHDNLALRDDGSVIAMYEVPASIISSMDVEGKIKFKKRTEAVFASLAPNLSFDIGMLPVPINLEERFGALLEDCADDTYDMALYFLEKTNEDLYGSIGQLINYKFFMTIPLKSFEVSGDIKQMLKDAWARFKEKAVAVVRQTLEFEMNWYEAYEKANRDLELNLSLIQGRKTTKKETGFYQRVDYLRGLTYNRDEEIASIESSVQNIDDTVIEPLSNGVIGLKNSYGKSLVKTLPIANMPNVVNNLHLVEHAQKLPFPIELHWKFHFSKMKGAFSLASKGERASDRIKENQIEAYENGSNQKGSLATARVILDEMTDGVDNRELFVNYLATFVVAGQSMREVNYYKKIIQSDMKDIGVQVVSGMSDQLYFFYKNRFIEQLEEKDKYCIQAMKLSSACENLFFTSQKIGSDIGFPIGRIDHAVESWAGDYKKALASSTNAVFLNLFQANKQGIAGKITDNPAFAIVGQTGEGKSFLTKGLFLCHSLLKALTLYIDPKNEMKAQYMKIKAKYEANFPKMEFEIEQAREAIEDEEQLYWVIRGIEYKYYKPVVDYINNIHFVSLDAKEESNHGALDPLVFLHGDACKKISVKVTEELLGEKYTKEDKFEIAFLESLDAVMSEREKGKKVGLLNVFERLLNSTDEMISTRANLALRKIKNSQMELVFSHGKNSAVDMDARITVLGVTGLNLPKADEKITSDHKQSLIVMYALGEFCREFGERDRTQETIIFVDEAWFFNKTEIGASILMSMKRVGRSQNNFLGLITQSISDVETEDDSTAFGTIFAFREPTETDKVLNYFKLPVEETTQAWYDNMTKGQCIMRDPFGRTARITVDFQLPEVTVLFDTVETKMKNTKAVA